MMAQDLYLVLNIRNDLVRLIFVNGELMLLLQGSLCSVSDFRLIFVNGELILLLQGSL